MLNKLTPTQIMKTSAEYGAYACIAFIVYFIAMRLIGMATVVELRFLNYIFVIVAAFYAARKAESIKNWRLKYLQAFIVVFLTGTFSFLFFSVFMLIYSVFDPIILNTFAEMFTGASSLGRFSAPFLIASEGISISSIIGLGMGFFVQEYSGHMRKASGEVLYNDQKA
jgi:hypothetical protein